MSNEKTRLPFHLDDFLARFDTGNIFNAKDMILILRDEDSGPSHIVADLLEAQEDVIIELRRKLEAAVKNRKPRNWRKGLGR